MPQPKDDEDLRKASGVQSGAPPGGHPPSSSGVKPGTESNIPDEPPAPAEKPLPADEARVLLQAGHRLKKQGNPNTKWIVMTRVAGELCLCMTIDEEIEKELLSKKLVLISPPYQ
jgi:hypothetical protein